MADSPQAKSSGSILAKAQKRLNRTKAKMLQNFGKATRTTDHTFDEYVSNFNKQQAILTKLHKDLRNYTQSVKALCHANKILCDTMLEVYEEGWTDQLTFQQTVEIKIHNMNIIWIVWTAVVILVVALTKSFEILWNDYATSLHGRVQDPIQKHLNRFPDLRGKINKRGRKLVDLDNSRHVLDNLSNQKKRDDAKITKAQEELTESQKVFDEINETLHADLPEFYDDRIRFYSTTFQSLFAAESLFHSEMGKLSTNLIDVCEKLSANHVYLERKRPIQETNHINFDEQEARGSPVHSDGSSPTNTIFRRSESDVYENVTISSQDKRNGSNRASFPISSSKPRLVISSPIIDQSSANGAEVADNSKKEEKKEDEVDGEDGEEDDSQAGLDDDNLYQVPPSNQPIKKPPDGVLFSVQTTHPYNQGDSDELTFEAREIIYVVEPDNPEDMDEGWLMGIKQSDGLKGVFPENFTVRLTG